MALAKSRQAARRVKDRWKAKKWYKVHAPSAFNNALIAETLSDEPEKVMGRRVEATLHDLTGDMRQMHVKLFFRVGEITDFNAKAEFVGHAMTSDYVRRLTRRGHTKIPAVFDVQTKDGSRVRVKPFCVSDRRCQTTQAQAIRRLMMDRIEEVAKKTSLTGFLQKILIGELNQELYKEARKIHPIRRIEIAKTEILSAPSVEMDETPIIRPPEPEPEETESTDSEEEETEGTEAADDSEEE